MNSIILGTHQKIDRIARRKLQPYIPPGIHFPTSRQILNFEGLHGPDSVKLKTTTGEDPRHFINPDDPTDRALYDMVAAHEANLITALADNEREKAAFEAAWLAHALVDGLTPAHHYPYEEKLAELRGDARDKPRDTKLKRVFVPGDGVRGKLKNNLAFIGPKGLWMLHWQFEMGVDFVARPLRFSEVHLSKNDRHAVQKAGSVLPQYEKTVQKIHHLSMYDQFLDKGWTTRLARLTKNQLVPEVIHTVLLSWYYCAWAAREKNSRSSVPKKEN